MGKKLEIINNKYHTEIVIFNDENISYFFVMTLQPLDLPSTAIEDA